MGTVTTLSITDEITGTPQRVWNLPPDPYEIEVEKRDDVLRNLILWFSEETGTDLTQLDVHWNGTEFEFTYNWQASME